MRIEMPPDSLRRSGCYMILAAAFFAGMGALAKYATTELPNEIVVFCRSALGLLVLLPWLAHQGGVRLLRTARLPEHVLRSLIGLGSMYCFFYAVAHMPLAEAVLLNYSAPLFIPLVAWVWLGEPVSRQLLAATMLGFIGIVMILKPGMALFAPVALVGLAAGILAAIAMSGVRRLIVSEPASRIVFYFTLISTVVSALPLTWTWKTPQGHIWLTLCGVGTCASLGQLFMTRAYAFATAAQTGPFSYATVIFAAILGWIFWGEVPDLLSVIGTIIVGTGGALTIRFGTAQTRVTKPLPSARS